MSSLSVTQSPNSSDDDLESSVCSTRRRNDTTSSESTSMMEKMKMYAEKLKGMRTELNKAPDLKIQIGTAISNVIHRPTTTPEKAAELWEWFNEEGNCTREELEQFHKSRSELREQIERTQEERKRFIMESGDDSTEGTKQIINPDQDDNDFMSEDSGNKSGDSSPSVKEKFEHRLLPQSHLNNPSLDSSGRTSKGTDFA